MVDLLSDYLPRPLAVVVTALAAAGVLITFIAASAAWFIWLERKVSGRIQDRLGPTRTGGKFGWLQSLADAVKLLFKEDTVPGGASASSCDLPMRRPGGGSRVAVPSGAASSRNPVV